MEKGEEGKEGGRDVVVSTGPVPAGLRLHVAMAGF